MRQFLKKITFKIGVKQPFYAILSKLGDLFKKPNIKLRLQKIRAENRFIKHLGPQVQVMNGPFKGLIYPFKNAFYSSFTPKILGCYEEELHPHIDKLLSHDYDLALDIGSAEGYYANGILLRKPNLPLIAYDINQEARNLTNIMAEINKVENRITIKGTCQPTDIDSLNPSKKYLIICDCEGYENNLFTKNNLNRLSLSSLIIELHDQYVANTTKNLKELFSENHEVEIIENKSRGNKNKYLTNLGFSDEEIYLLLSEERDGIVGTKTMNWLVATPK